jgi:hypothetical protein
MGGYALQRRGTLDLRLRLGDLCERLVDRPRPRRGPKGSWPPLRAGASATLRT